MIITILRIINIILLIILGLFIYKDKNKSENKIHIIFFIGLVILFIIGLIP